MEQISAVELKRFCDEESRRGLNEPFSDAVFSYACNGHMLLRVPRISNVDKATPEVVKLEKLPLDYKGAKYIEIPDYSSPEKEKCSQCNGSGRTETCVECEGEGYLELSTDHNYYEVECKTCHGHGSTPGGEIECTWCGGAGEVYKDHCSLAHDYGDGWGLSAQMLDRIKELPGVKINDHNLGGVVPFVFDGGDGVFMCMATVSNVRQPARFHANINRNNQQFRR